MAVRVQETRKVSRRRFLKAAGVGLVASGLVAACEPTVAPSGQAGNATSPSGEPVDIHFTHRYPVAIYDPLAFDLVGEQVADVNLTIDTTGGATQAAYATSIITRIAGGENVDIIYLAIEGVPLMSERNIIRVLDPYLEADEETAQDYQNDIHPRLMEALQWKGQQMEIPIGWNNMIIYYNPVMYEEKQVETPTQDWTWEDFLERCVALADVQGAADDVYAYSFWDTMFGMAPWYFNNDTSPLNEDWTESNMNDPKVAETLQFLADLILEHNVSPNPAGWDEAGQFHSEHLAMLSCGGWCVQGAINADFTNYSFELYPHRAGPLRTVIGVGGYGITTMSANPDKAWEVLTALNSTEIQMKWLEFGRGPVSRQSVSETTEWLNEANSPTADMTIFYDSLDQAMLVPSPPNYDVVDPLLTRWYASIWNGEMSVEEAVAGAHEELQVEMLTLQEG